MKQTVVILTALMLAMMVVSGFIVAGSTQQNQLLAAREEELRMAQIKIGELEENGEKWEREARRNAKLSAELTEQRDALNKQLGDALLSSQESNDAIEQQSRELLQLEKDYTQLFLDYQELKQAQPKPTLPPIQKPAQKTPPQ